MRSDQDDEWQSMIYPTNVQCSLPKVLDHMLNDHLISHVIDRPFLLFHRMAEVAGDFIPSTTSTMALRLNVERRM